MKISKLILPIMALASMNNNNQVTVARADRQMLVKISWISVKFWHFRGHLYYFGNLFCFFFGIGKEENKLWIS